MKTRVALCMLVLSFLFPGATAYSQNESRGKSIIVLDASGSMWGQINGEAKIDIAKQVVSDLLSTLDPSIELGLLAYGHRRKGDCTDIELLISPGKVDRQAFAEVVQGISPKGKTPLTDAVEQAARHLKYEEAPADVILVSDGIETCDKDPCELARMLAATGVRFRSHVIGFDLTAEEASTIRCLADETGGKFLPAQDARSLQDALNIVVDEVISVPPAEVAAPEKLEEPEEEPIPEAELRAADSVTAGSDFEVGWTGPSGKGDYITIVKKGTDDRLFGNSAYTSQGNPVSVTALIDPGECELRYIWGKRSKVIARRPIMVTKIEATVKALQDEVLAGAPFDVEWTGPGNKGDYITITTKDAEPGAYQNYKYARKDHGSPVTLRAGEVPGEFEVRYVTGQKRRILATTSIKVTPAAATVAGPEEVAAGSKFEVTWTGPANQHDYIAIVPRGEPNNTVSYAYAKQTNPVTVKAGESPGDFDLVYMTRGRKVLAKVPIKVIAVTASLNAIAEVIAGSRFDVEWTGPGNQGDFITIVPPSAAASESNSYAYTKRKKSPVQLDALEIDGDFELRYVTPKRNILARRPIKIVPAKVTLNALETAIVGAEFAVEWTGPDNARDLIVIVPQGAKEGSYGNYVQTKAGSPANLAALAEPGDAEIRYLTGKGKKTLESRPIKVVAADIKFTVAEKVAVSSKFRLEFSGAPNHPRDLIILAAPGSKKAEKTYYVSRGSPQEVTAPKNAGKFELRYITGKKRNVIATHPIEVVAE